MQHHADLGGRFSACMRTVTILGRTDRGTVGAVLSSLKPFPGTASECLPPHTTMQHDLGACGPCMLVSASARETTADVQQRCAPPRAVSR
eukprot:8529043-Alexandrium_andersonii.AAC.1